MANTLHHLLPHHWFFQPSFLSSLSIIVLFINEIRKANSKKKLDQEINQFIESKIDKLKIEILENNLKI